MTLSTTTLLDKTVGSTGFGLMNFTWREDPIPEEQAFATLKAALAQGANFWNGGEFYGPPHHNSLHLLKAYFTKYPEDADKVVLSIKGGWDASRHGINGSPENVRRSVEFCNGILAGTKKIDIFEIARVDKQTPIEETVGALEQLRQEGKIGGIGLSEVGAEKIERAVKVAPIAAVEVEVSLFSRDIFENGVAQVCAKHHIPVVAYSPLARGMLFIKPGEDFQPNKLVQAYPRFQGEALQQNLKLVSAFRELAASKGCTTGQLGLSWLKALSERDGNPVIIPLPGTTSVERVKENTTDVELTEEDLKKIQDAVNAIPVAGGRYPEFMEKSWDF